MADFAAIMAAPMTPDNLKLPGAVVTDCADCRAVVVYSNRCPEWLPKLCPRCIAKLLEKQPDAEIMTPSGLGSIFAVGIGENDNGAET